MKLKGRYRILVEGDTDKLGVGFDHTIIGYLFQRLLTGQDAEVNLNLRNLGIQVLECDDGSDEFVKIPRLED